MTVIWQFWSPFLYNLSSHQKMSKCTLFLFTCHEYVFFLGLCHSLLRAHHPFSSHPSFPSSSISSVSQRCQIVSSALKMEILRVKNQWALPSGCSGRGEHYFRTAPDQVSKTKCLKLHLIGEHLWFFKLKTTMAVITALWRQTSSPLLIP